MTSGNLVKTIYDTDFVLWLETTANLLRERKLDDLDYENLIEEIEDMGKSARNALKSNLTILLIHLLKWYYQPQKRSGSWSYTILEHHFRILEAFQDSPSLKQYFEGIFDGCYTKAVTLASSETGLSVDSFPARCPFSIDQILDINALPRWQKEETSEGE